MKPSQAAQYLADELISKEEFSPLVRLVPDMAEIAASFDAVVARTQSGNVLVHALLGLEKHRPDDLRLLGVRLRDSAEAAAPRIRGRVVISLILIHEKTLSTEYAAVMKSMLGGGMMAKVLTLRMSLQLKSEGQALRAVTHKSQAPEPGLDWFERSLSRVNTRLRPTDVERTLYERDKEQLLIRAWFKPGPTWAVWGLIALNILVYLYQQSVAEKIGETASMVMLGANARDLTLGEGQWWRLGSAMFLHFGLMHLAFNMVSLYSLGGFLERLLGSGRFLAIYIGCGLFSSMASLANPPVAVSASGEALYVLSAGASGAIFAVAGALLALKLKRPRHFPRKLAERLFSSLAKPIGAFIVFGFLWSLLVQSMEWRLPQLDNFAHLGGLLAGILSMILWPARMREKYNFQA